MKDKTIFLQKGENIKKNPTSGTFAVHHINNLEKRVSSGVIRFAGL